MGWAKAKTYYASAPDESVPLIRRLNDVSRVEVDQTEEAWGEWLDMEDWTLGPRTQEELNKLALAMLRLKGFTIE
jgi:hypothetical protein